MDLFWHFMSAGGWVMYPLLFLSIAAGTVCIERYLSFRTLGNTSPGLLQRIAPMLQKRDFVEASKICEPIDGPVSAVLKTIIEKRDLPKETVEGFVEEVGQEYFSRLEDRLSLLDTTTTVAPLLGLLGTILGMIAAFQAISSAGSQGNSDQILSGVAEALYATASGITLAILCFMSYNYFSARIRRIIRETETAATKALNIISFGDR